MICDKNDCVRYDIDTRYNCLFPQPYTEYCLKYDYVNFFKKDIEDNVNSPKHYTQYKKEVIDIIKDCLTDEEFKGYLKGNIIKYRMRAGLKDDREQDLAKSNYYQDKLGGLK